MNLLLVDDEPLARQRLRRLLAALPAPLQTRVDEAEDAASARRLLRQRRYDVVLLDIQMPGDSGLRLAAELDGPDGPALVFVTAHEEHALHAFEHGAHDYLTKPVAAERLQQALLRVLRRRQQPTATQAALTINERGALLRVPLSEVLYFRAQDKYTVVRTVARSYLSEDALGELEQRFADQLLRVHRSVLVARQAIASLERSAGGDAGGDAVDTANWRLRLRGIDETLPVSRRQLALLRGLLRGR